MDKLVALGYVDTFRHFNKEPGQYSWWDLKSRARERNVGWRIDYFFVTQNLVPQLVKASDSAGGYRLRPLSYLACAKSPVICRRRASEPESPETRARLLELL